jgi:hypothetical protein
MKNWKVLELAREAGFTDTTDEGVWITDGYWTEEMERFADLVARYEQDRIFATLRQLFDAALLAPEPGQLKDRGKK